MNIYALRKQNKKSQREIAKVLGITQSNYSKYELETTKPNIEMIEKLADYYDVSTDTILGHKTNSIEFGTITMAQKKVVMEIINCDDLICEKADAYIQGLIVGENERKKITEKF